MTANEAEQVLPDAKFVFDKCLAGLVVIDPQNDAVGDAYLAAVTNYAFLARAVWMTEEAVSHIAWPPDVQSGQRWAALIGRLRFGSPYRVRNASSLAERTLR